MPNILINPNSGLIEFTTGAADGSSFNTNFTGGALAARLSYDNFGSLNLTSYVSSITGLDRFNIDGANGRLFSVTDNLSGSLFSVNDIAGLPIIEVFDDNTIIMGGFNRTDFILTGNSLGLGATPNTGTTKLYVSGNVNVIGSGIFSNGSTPAVTLLNNPLSVVGSGNSYLQLNIQNRATGATSSADLVITANNGTDNANYINLGINNSGYNDPAFSNGSGLDGYLFIDGGNLDIGTRTAGRAIEFHAGGTTLGSTIARISQSGFNLVSGNFTYPVFSGATGFVFTPDASASTFFDYTLSGNSTLNQPINMSNGQSITIFLTQDGTGNRNMSFNTGYLFSNGITPSLNFLPSGTDILQVIKARNKLYSTFASNY